MRDHWYDERLGNRNWDAVRRKYADAAETPDGETLATVVKLMLGELNGSHLGFTLGTQQVLAHPRPEPTVSPEPAGRWIADHAAPRPPVRRRRSRGRA